MIYGAPAEKEPRVVLKPGAVYLADSGEAICVHCAGASALYTGRDLSGQEVLRMRVSDVRAWDAMFPNRPCGCERGCTVITAIAGPDGWPMAVRS